MGKLPTTNTAPAAFTGPSASPKSLVAISENTTPIKKDNYNQYNYFYQVSFSQASFSVHFNIFGTLISIL